MAVDAGGDRIVLAGIFGGEIANLGSDTRLHIGPRAMRVIAFDSVTGQPLWITSLAIDPGNARNAWFDRIGERILLTVEYASSALVDSEMIAETYEVDGATGLLRSLPRSNWEAPIFSVSSSPFRALLESVSSSRSLRMVGAMRTTFGVYFGATYTGEVTGVVRVPKSIGSVDSFVAFSDSVSRTVQANWIGGLGTQKLMQLFGDPDPAALLLVRGVLRVDGREVGRHVQLSHWVILGFSKNGVEWILSGPLADSGRFRKASQIPGVSSYVVAGERDAKAGCGISGISRYDVLPSPRRANERKGVPAPGSTRRGGH